MCEENGTKGMDTELFRVVHSFKKLNISSILPNITHMEFGTMNIIYEGRGQEQDGMKVSELVNHMKVAAPAVSRLLRGLEEKNFVERTTDKRDRRGTYVKLTPFGEETLLESRRIMQTFSDAVLGEMGEENIKKLTAYLSRLQEVSLQEINKLRYKNREDEAKNEEDI